MPLNDNHVLMVQKTKENRAKTTGLTWHVARISDDIKREKALSAIIVNTLLETGLRVQKRAEQKEV